MPRYVFLILSAAILLLSRPVFAATYEITARQINPDGPTQTALCSDENKTCYMSVVFIPASGFHRAQDTYLDMAMHFKGEDIKLHFMWNRDYLFTRGDKDKKQGYGLPLNKGAQTHNVMLLKPSDLEKKDPKGALILRSPSAIAELKLSIKPQTE